MKRVEFRSLFMISFILFILSKLFCVLSSVLRTL